MKRIRRPKNPRYVDIEVLPDEDEEENLEDQETEGVTYRVSEKGVKLDFIERVKRSVAFPIRLTIPNNALGRTKMLRRRKQRPIGISTMRRPSSMNLRLRRARFTHPKSQIFRN
jgi:hypothetical protein